MAMNMGGSGQFESEINVTPLVDVVLVLLIIFMVIIPATMRGYDVDIPGEATVTTPPEEITFDQVVLGISLSHCPIVEPPSAPGLPANCQVRLNDDVMGVADLAAEIQATFGARDPSKRVLFLSADDGMNYEGVMRIVDVAKSAVDGLRIGLITEAEADADGLYASTTY